MNNDRPNKGNPHYNILKWFIITANIEAVSWLLLLGFAMPMKYMQEDPTWVTLLGRIHGFLFCAFVPLLILAWRKYKWTYERSAILFIASFIPFLPFYFDRKLKKEAGI